MKRLMRGIPIELFVIISITVLLTASCGPQSATVSQSNLLSADKPSVVALSKVVSTGAVGDVKYSILEPDKFIKQNGEGWVLMEDRDIKGTDLWRLTGLEKLPDARGVFIRGMNKGRDPQKGDADGDRQVGSFQLDSFASHHHPVGPLEVGHTVNGNGGPHRIDSDDGPSWNNYHIKQVAEDVGGNETRPRNISLYLYIKVSEPVNPNPQ